MSSRTFFHNPNPFIEDLPLILTRYKDPVYTLHKYGHAIEKVPKKAYFRNLQGRCNHCKRGKRPLARVIVRYWNGQEDEKKLCSVCIEYVDNKTGVTWKPNA